MNNKILEHDLMGDADKDSSDVADETNSIFKFGFRILTFLKKLARS